MNKSMWNNEAVKAYESGQGVVMVEKPYPHYEPVACLPPTPISENALYITLPPRTWIGLTDEEIEALAKQHNGIFYDCDIEFAHAIEAKLKERNS